MFILEIPPKHVADSYINPPNMSIWIYFFNIHVFT